MAEEGIFSFISTQRQMVQFRSFIFCIDKVGKHYACRLVNSIIQHHKDRHIQILFSHFLKIRYDKFSFSAWIKSQSVNQTQEGEYNRQLLYTIYFNEMYPRQLDVLP